MSGELVPFGKHKGQPVEVLLADPGYVEWLVAQPWFRDRYPTFHQTIINYGGEPQETPEHNQMQAAFLDDGRCLALARLLYPTDLFDGKSAARLAGRDRAVYERLEEHLRPVSWTPTIHSRAFEVDGWDVVYMVQSASCGFELKSMPACACARCSHERDCPGRSPCRGGDGTDYDCRHRGHGQRECPTFESWQKADQRTLDDLARYGADGHCDPTCPWSDRDVTRWLVVDERRFYQPHMPGRIRVECKPDLGDDFPSVLRQVNRYSRDDYDRVVVLVRRHRFEHVTWEQVAQMFAASNVVLLAESRLNDDAGEARQGGVRP